MRIALLMLLSIACASSTVDGPLPFRIIGGGSDPQGPAAQGAGARIAVASDQRAYEQLWQSIAGTAAAPPVDFTKEEVVALMSGSRNTGGYAVSLEGVTVAKGVLTLDAPVTTPGRRTIVTDAFTFPFQIAAIRRTASSSIRWMNGSSLVTAITR